MNLKTLFKRKTKKRQEFQRFTFTMKPLNTESIKVSNENSSLVIKLEGERWRPFEMKVKKEYLHALHRDLNTLNGIAREKNHEFNVFPFMDSFDEVKRREVYLDPNREDKHVFDIDLYFNEDGEIDSFSIGTRPRFFAFADEPPKVIEKTSLSEFQKAMDYLMEQI